MKVIATSFSLFCLLLSSLALGHVSMSSSIPASGAVLKVSPAELSLVFSGKVRVAKVVLTDSDGKIIDFGFTPPKTWGKQFSWPVSALPAQSYQVTWVVIGKDGHKMKGSYPFIVE